MNNVVGNKIFMAYSCQRGKNMTLLAGSAQIRIDKRFSLPNDIRVF